MPPPRDDRLGVDVVAPPFFIEYESQFQALHSQIASETVRLVAHGEDAPPDAAAASKELESSLLQADELIKQMDIEARTSDDGAASRKALKERVDVYRRGVKALRAEVKCV